MRKKPNKKLSSHQVQTPPGPTDSELADPKILNEEKKIWLDYKGAVARYYDIITRAVNVLVPYLNNYHPIRTFSGIDIPDFSVDPSSQTVTEEADTEKAYEVPKSRRREIVKKLSLEHLSFIKSFLSGPSPEDRKKARKETMEALQSLEGDLSKCLSELDSLTIAIGIHPWRFCLRTPEDTEREKYSTVPTVPVKIHSILSLSICLEKIMMVTDKDTFLASVREQLYSQWVDFERLCDTVEEQLAQSEGKATETPKESQKGQGEDKGTEIGKAKRQWGIDREKKLVICNGRTSKLPDTLFGIYEKFYDNDETPVSLTELCKVTGQERGYIRDYVIDLKNKLAKELKPGKDLEDSRALMEKIIERKPPTGKIRTFTFHKNI